MTFSKLLGVLVLCSIVAFTVTGDEEEPLLATTEDGCQVILYDDGTWEWFSSSEQASSDWRAPTIDELRQAFNWGQKESGWAYASDAMDFYGSGDWIVCEGGPYKAGGCPEQTDSIGPNRILVGTPLCLTASYGVEIFGDTVKDKDLEDFREQFNNKIEIFLKFRGSALYIVPASYYQPMIIQGDLVLQPFEAHLDYESLGGSGDISALITISCKFMVKDLDPDKAFWFSASQPLGELRFQFKIDPSELGTEEFF